MRTKYLSYNETMREYFCFSEKSNCFVKQWERILEERAEELIKELRARPSKIDNLKVDNALKVEKQIKEDLISENQRLRMETEYLKN